MFVPNKKKERGRFEFLYCDILWDAILWLDAGHK